MFKIVILNSKLLNITFNESIKGISVDLIEINILLTLQLTGCKQHVKLYIYFGLHLSSIRVIFSYYKVCVINVLQCKMTEEAEAEAEIGYRGGNVGS